MQRLGFSTEMNYQLSKILTENNKHYWRNTILAPLIIGTIMFILGLFSTEVKELLLSAL